MTQTIEERGIISQIFFIRVAEIFKAITILLSTDLDQVIPSTILLRSLSEYYILLSSSIEDETFNGRHIKHAFTQKEDWLTKTLKHLPLSGFKQEPKYFEEMREKTQQLQIEYEKNLQPIYRLFEDRKELLMYLNVYIPASSYVHGNRQSFNIYHLPNGGIKATPDRDYSSLLRTTGLASAQIMLKSFEQFCKALKHETPTIKLIEELLEKSAGAILRSMPSD